ncbi:MAG: flagellar filament capping protein FliD [Solirubrobacterales bacterium]|nr:flagellar filament capping protein FliD [Solirubrobacterales bacterium]
MSTQGISSGTSATSSNQYASGSSLSSLGSNSAMQITGLASGLNTNAVVQALMAAQQQQVTNLQNQQSGITALNKNLTSIQTALQTVADDAQALGNPSLFANTQTITSTNSTLVGATAASANGAVVGSYSIGVTALASASQETFTFNSPSSADTVTIGGQAYNLAAGASADDLVSAINSDPNGKAWATVTQEGVNGGPATVVLSDRQTGVPTSNDLTPTTGTSLTGGTNYIAGTDAQYTINGSGPYYSSSNTISGASLGGTGQPTEGQGADQTIPGVTVSLNGITGSTPATVTVAAPAPSTQNIQTAVQKFVTDYNSAISQIQTQLSQTPTSSDPTQGTLYGDSDLQQLLSSMRQMMTATVGGLTGPMSSMLDAGVSTGTTTGSGTVSQNALAGDLTLDTATLTTALASNASGVKSMFTSWSIGFSGLVNNEAAAGGTISTRIQSDTSQSSFLSTQIANLQQANTVKQNELVQEFAAMEAALSQNQSTSSWLTSQLAALPTA